MTITPQQPNVNRDLIEVLDRLHHIRNLVEAGYMAAGDLTERTATNALQAVASSALTALGELDDFIEVMRQPEQAGA